MNQKLTRKEFLRTGTKVADNLAGQFNPLYTKPAEVTARRLTDTEQAIRIIPFYFPLSRHKTFRIFTKYETEPLGIMTFHTNIPAPTLAS